MATRDITVRIKAEIGAFKRDMAAAADAAKKTANETEKAGKAAESGIGKLAQTAQTHEKAWGQVSSGMVVSGTAIVGALALTGKAAMDWQSQWTGVTKTVDGTPQQLAEVENGLRNLAKTLPSTHAEIAGVAEAAGQLGVARDDITGFTKTMIDLGETTNLTAEEAATNIAQISNVMGTMEREGSKGVERFGATLVALGNDGASTEAEILNMAQRIAGAGASLGATESDVLALSNTLASMGVRAELGGGVATRVLLKMRTAVDEGGESVQAFADVAGTSAEEFASKFSSSPMEALQLVAEGIARTNAEGGNLTATLKDMGIKGTEEMQVMLALANSGDLLTESLKLGSVAWEENSALVEEANKRYETAESRIAIAWNNIKDSAIDAGAVILPAISAMADAVSELASWFGDLPGPVQTALTVLGGVAGVGLLAAGGFMKIVSALGDTIPKMQALGIDTPRATRAISGFGKVLGGVTLVGAGIVAGKIAIEAINDAVRSGKPDVEAYFNLLATGGGVDMIEALGLDEGNRGKLFPESAKRDMMDFYGTLTVESANAKQAIEQLGNTNGLSGLTGWFSKNLSFGDVRAATEDALQLQEAMRGIGRAFDMGESEKGTAALNDFKNELELTDAEIATLINSTPELKSALMNLATEGGIKIDPNNELGLVDLALGRIKGSAPGAAEGIAGVDGALDGTAVSAEDATAAIDNFYAAMVNAGMVVLGEREALRALEESFDSAAASIAENGKNLDTSTEKGRANQAALDGIASASLRAMEAQREAGASTSELAGTLAAGRDAFIENAMAAGMSEKAAGALADQLGLIPGSVYIEFQENTDSVAGKITEIHELVQSTPDGQITITENSPVVRAALEDLGYIVTTLPDGTIKVSETGTDSTGKKIDATAGKKRTAKINAEAITKSADSALNGTASKKRTATIFATAVTGAAEAGMDRAARDRNATIWVRERVVSGGSQGATGRGGSGGITRATGGPVFGPGTETSDSIPAWLSTNEHVLSAKEVRGLGGHSAVEDLRAMARSNNTPAFANGGAVGRAESKVKSTKRTYDRIDGKKANRLRKLAAKDQWEAAKDELKAAKAQSKLSADARKKASEAAKERAKEERERQTRLSEGRFDLSRDLKRGDIRESFMSGSGMSVVDRLFEQSSNKDLSKGKRASLRSTAYGMETQLLKLEKRSDSLAKSLDKATSKRDELLSARNQVRDSMVGAFDLGSLAGQKNKFGYDTHVGKRGLLAFGKNLATGAKKLSGKVSKLQKLGFNESMIQQAIDEWSSTGTFELADAMLSMNKGERSQFTSSFKSLERYGTSTGNSLTKSMHKGGLDAANGLVRGLESKSKDVDNAFYKMGKQAEKAFKRSLGIKSPSTVMFGAGVNVGEGAELGILSKVGAVESAAAKLMAPPTLMVPPSYEVARYATGQAGPSVAIDYNQLAQAMANVQLNANLTVDRRQAGTLVQAGQKFNGTHK